VQCTVYTVPVFDSEHELKKLNEFLRSNKIYHVEKQFFVAGQNAYWSFCVEYEGKQKPQAQGRIDYKEKLSEVDFAIFSKLRDLRTTCAKEHNIPLYGVFTNEQLVQMIYKKTTTIADLKQIPGIGKSKIDAYGNVFSSFLGTLFKTEHETN